MKITVPEKWMEAADRFEAEGIELAVIGHPKPTGAETQEFLEKRERSSFSSRSSSRPISRI